MSSSFIYENHIFFRGFRKYIYSDEMMVEDGCRLNNSNRPPRRTSHIYYINIYTYIYDSDNIRVIKFKK